MVLQLGRLKTFFSNWEDLFRLSTQFLFILQGDVKISSNEGNIISSKRFMGPNVEIETEHGDLRGNIQL